MLMNMSSVPSGAFVDLSQNSLRTPTHGPSNAYGCISKLARQYDDSMEYRMSLFLFQSQAPSFYIFSCNHCFTFPKLQLYYHHLYWRIVCPHRPFVSRTLCFSHLQSNPYSRVPLAPTVSLQVPPSVQIPPIYTDNPEAILYALVISNRGAAN